MYHVGDHGTVCPSTGTYNETYVTLCGLGVKVVLSKQENLLQTCPQANLIYMVAGLRLLS